MWPPRGGDPSTHTMPPVEKARPWRIASRPPGAPRGFRRENQLPREIAAPLDRIPHRTLTRRGTHDMRGLQRSGLTFFRAVGTVALVMLASAPARAQIVLDGNLVFNNNASGTFAGQFVGTTSTG